MVSGGNQVVNVTKQHSAQDLRQNRERFEAVFQRYRVSLHGQKAFDKEALRFAYGKFCNYDMDLIESIVDEIATSGEKSMAMAPLVQAIEGQLKRKFLERSTYVQGINARIEIDPAEAEAIRINQEQFARFKAYVAERGNKWWSDTLYNALSECNIANIHASIAKNGPECYMNWIMIKNHLKTLAGVWGRVE